MRSLRIRMVVLTFGQAAPSLDSIASPVAAAALVDLALLLSFLFEIALFELLVHQCCVFSVDEVVHERGEYVDEHYRKERQQYRHRRYPAPAKHIQQQQSNTEYQQEMYRPQYQRQLYAFSIKADENGCREGGDEAAEQYLPQYHAVHLLT